MDRTGPYPLNDADVLALTARGEAELKSGQTALGPLELRLMVLFDGRSNFGAIRAHVAGHSEKEIATAVTRLLSDGMICRDAPAASGGIDFDMSGMTGWGRTEPRPETPEAASGVQSLKDHGYFVRIARRPANAPALPAGRKPVVIVVEDEEHLAKFLGHFLGFEGFESRIARNRDEVVAALRTPPVPDLILLDVMLPDADGFDILEKVRQYPALLHVPVIMITAKATREAVLRGLSGGADGYITKPFQTEVLTKAIRTIFGLTQPLTSTDTWHRRDV